MVFAALDFFPLRRLGLEPAQWFAKRNRFVWREKIPYAVIALFFGWLNLHVRGTVNTGVKPATLAEFGIIPRVMQALFIWAHNVWKPFVPFHLTPVPSQLVDFKPFAPLFVFSAVLVIGLTMLFLFKVSPVAGNICGLGVLSGAAGASAGPFRTSALFRRSLQSDCGYWLVHSAGQFAGENMAPIQGTLYFADSHRRCYLWVKHFEPPANRALANKHRFLP